MSPTTRSIANKRGSRAQKIVSSAADAEDQAPPADSSPMLTGQPLTSPFTAVDTAEAMIQQPKREWPWSTGLPWRNHAVETALMGIEQHVNPMTAVQTKKAMATEKSRHQHKPAVSPSSTVVADTSKPATGSRQSLKKHLHRRQPDAAADMTAQQPLPAFSVPNRTTTRYLLIPTQPPGHYQYGPIRPIIAPPLQLPPPPMMPSQPRLAPIPDGIKPHRQPYPKTGTRGLRNLNRLYKALRMYIQAGVEDGLSHENVLWVLTKCHEKFLKNSQAKAKQERKVDGLAKGAAKAADAAAAMNRDRKRLTICPSMFCEQDADTAAELLAARADLEEDKSDASTTAQRAAETVSDDHEEEKADHWSISLISPSTGQPSRPKFSTGASVALVNSDQGSKVTTTHHLSAPDMKNIASDVPRHLSCPPNLTTARDSNECGRVTTKCISAVARQSAYKAMGKCDSLLIASCIEHESSGNQDGDQKRTTSSTVKNDGQVLVAVGHDDDMMGVQRLDERGVTNDVAEKGPACAVTDDGDHDS